MKLRPRRLALILFVVPAMGCGKQHVGPRFGGSAIPGQFLQHCYVLQRDVRPTHGAAKPLFLIVWKAGTAGSCSMDSRNRLSSIHGKVIHLRFDTTTVYALQPDYTLKRIRLTGSEIERVFRAHPANAYLPSVESCAGVARKLAWSPEGLSSPARSL